MIPKSALWTVKAVAHAVGMFDGVELSVSEIIISCPLSVRVTEIQESFAFSGNICQALPFDSGNGKGSDILCARGMSIVEGSILRSICCWWSGVG